MPPTTYYKQLLRWFCLTVMIPAVLFFRLMTRRVLRDYVGSHTINKY